MRRRGSGGPLRLWGAGCVEGLSTPTLSPSSCQALRQQGEEALRRMLLALLQEDPRAGHLFTLLDVSGAERRRRGTEGPSKAGSKGEPSGEKRPPHPLHDGAPSPLAALEPHAGSRAFSSVRPACLSQRGLFVVAPQKKTPACRKAASRGEGWSPAVSWPSFLAGPTAWSPTSLRLRCRFLPQQLVYWQRVEWPAPRARASALTRDLLRQATRMPSLNVRPHPPPERAGLQAMGQSEGRGIGGGR